MFNAYQLPWRLRTFFALIFFTNLNECIAHIKSNTTNEYDLMSEILQFGQKNTNNLSSGGKRVGEEDVSSENTSKNTIEEKLFKESIDKILMGLLTTPKDYDDNQAWEDNAVKPIIRYNEWTTRAPKTELDNMMEEILRRIEKSMHKNVIQGKKKFKFRNKHKIKSTTTENYERKRLKDFFTILRQLNEMGLSVEQMDHISKEPSKFRDIGSSLDERQRFSVLEKLIDECNEVPVKVSGSENSPAEEIVKVLGEKSGVQLKSDLVKLLYALNSYAN